MSHSKDTANQYGPVLQKGTLLRPTVTLTTDSVYQQRVDGGDGVIVRRLIRCSGQQLPPVTLSPEMSTHLPPPRYLTYLLSSPHNDRTSGTPDFWHLLSDSFPKEVQ